MDKKQLLLGVAAVAIGTAAIALTPRGGRPAEVEKPKAQGTQNVLIGDVGGTNVRL